MTWVINADLYPLLSCELALYGIIRLGHVTNCKKKYFGNVIDDIILISTRLCEFMTLFLRSGIICITYSRWLIQGPPQPQSHGAKAAPYWGSSSSVV
jgi:hypothetical protein